MAAGVYRYGVLAALGVCAAALVVTLGISAAQSIAASSLPGEEKSGSKVFVATGQIAPNAHGLYLVDYENQTICVYQYNPKDRKLALLAARTYRFDAKLDAFNSAQPTPAEVRELVRDQKRLTLSGSNDQGQ